jgi:hypothetical protein
MTTTHKSTKPEKTEPLETFLPVYEKNIERVADLQKKILDVAAEQTTEVLAAWKKVVNVIPNAPGLFLFDLFEQSVEQAIETEKGMIDLLVEHSRSLPGVAREQGTSTAKAIDTMSSLVEQSVERAVSLQKKTLDTYAEQGKRTYELAKKQFRFGGFPGTEAFEAGLDALIETQKVMLDVASKPLKHVAAAA